MLNIIFISIIMVLLAVGAMSVRLIFHRDKRFSGGSCSGNSRLEERGVTCGCGREKSCADEGKPAEAGTGGN